MYRQSKNNNINYKIIQFGHRKLSNIHGPSEDNPSEPWDFEASVRDPAFVLCKYRFTYTTIL